MTKALQKIIVREFPNMDAKEKEELLRQTEDCIYRFGVFQTATIGKVAERYWKEEIEK